MHTRQEIIEHVYRRYQRAKKSEKMAILDEFVATTGYERNYAAWVLAH